MPVPIPADKRFRRAHVSPSKRRTWGERWLRLAKLIAICAIGGFALYTGVSRLLAADALTITKIRVSGNTRLSRGEVLALLEGLQGTSLLDSDLEQWRQRLLSSPWVADAAMRRSFPGTVAVAISERQPLGIGRLGEQLYLVDERGEVIDEYGPNYGELDLPLIDGLAAHGVDAGTLVDEARAALAGRLLSALQRRPDLSRRVSQIDVTDVRDAVVVLDGDTTLVRVGDDHFVDRLQSYLDLVPVLRDRVPDIDSVDLRFDERVYVRPQGPRKGQGS